MFYVLLPFAAIGALVVLALFLRLSGFKGLKMELEFHKPPELMKSDVHLAKSSQSLLRNGHDSYK